MCLVMLSSSLIISIISEQVNIMVSNAIVSIFSLFSLKLDDAIAQNIEIGDVSIVFLNNRYLHFIYIFNKPSRSTEI